MASTTRSRSRATGAETATDTRADVAEATPSTAAAGASTATATAEEVRAQDTGTVDPEPDPAAEAARAQATGTTSDSGPVDEPGVVVTADGVEHVGVLPASAAVVNPLPADGDHDRVAMLSVRSDGTPDQHAPELIGDVEVARAATRKQFTEQAVSAADAQLVAQSVVTAGPSVTIIGTPEGEPDRIVPLTTDGTNSVTELQTLHDEVVEAAEAAADAAVDRLLADS